MGKSTGPWWLYLRKRRAEQRENKGVEVVRNERNERPKLTDLTFINRTFSKKYLSAEIDAGLGCRTGCHCCMHLVLILAGGSAC